jgi:hypothetical protein
MMVLLANKNDSCAILERFAKAQKKGGITIAGYAPLAL